MIPNRPEQRDTKATDSYSPFCAGTTKSKADDIDTLFESPYAKVDDIDTLFESPYANGCLGVSRLFRSSNNSPSLLLVVFYSLIQSLCFNHIIF